jgi:DNA-binding GntR family transcriptional regulator
MNSVTPFDQHKPRYVTLAEELTQAIRDGVYPVGSLLPTEPELCAKHDVSRHTLREAVRMMREMGLIRSRQGQGTRVESTDVPSRYVMTMDAIPDLWQYVEHSDLSVKRMRTITAADALTPLPGAKPSDDWCLVEATRRVEPGTPIAWKHVYIDAAYQDVVKDIGKRRIPIYSLIEQQYGIKTVRVHQQLSAATIPDSAAEALNLDAGSAGFEIIRHYYDSKGRVFEVTMTIYPPNRFQYSADLMLAHGTTKFG